MRGMISVALLLVALIAAPASAQLEKLGKSGDPAKPTQTDKGQVLADAKGMTLYTFDRDTPGTGQSACTGQCATNWPPLRASADAKPMGKWSIITRDDGSKQWAYDGKPLYTWAKDAKPGDTTGDGINNVWHVARP